MNKIMNKILKSHLTKAQGVLLCQNHRRRDH